MTTIDRKKASDIFNEKKSPFSTKVSFEEAFPKIKEIKIEVIETEGGGLIDFDEDEDKTKQYRSTFSMNVGEYIDCNNLVCYSGGFSIGEILRDMVLKNEINKEDKARCKGYEGTPKGRRRRSCMHEFYYRINIEYKEKV
jgi:hypothetical protein